MLGAYRATIKRLLLGGAPIYGGAMALMMGVLVIWANLLTGENSLSGPLAYLAGAQALALPLLAMDAYARPRRMGLAMDGGARQGLALGYLTGYLIACLPIALVAWAVLPQSDSWAGVLGYALSGMALLSLCLLLASWVSGRLAALLLGVGAMALAQAAPLAASWLDRSAPGAVAARAVNYLSPASRLSDFLNGSLDLAAMGYFAAIALLAVYLVGGGRRVAKGALCWALATVLLSLAPASIVAVDMTPGQVTTPSPQMALLLRGVNLPVTVYQLAPVGEEDPWVKLYLKKLDERHAYICARTLSPHEDPQLQSLDLPANTLVVEQDQQWTIVGYENMYQRTLGLIGPNVTFELEGALITALDDVTGLTMAQAGLPPGRLLSQSYTIKEEARSQLTVGLVLCPLALLAAGVALTFVRKRYEQ